jgi:hypothetical protein
LSIIDHYDLNKEAYKDYVYIFEFEDLSILKVLNMIDIPMIGEHILIDGKKYKVVETEVRPQILETVFKLKLI